MVPTKSESCRSNLAPWLEPHYSLAPLRPLEGGCKTCPGPVSQLAARQLTWHTSCRSTVGCKAATESTQYACWFLTPTVQRIPYLAPPARSLCFLQMLLNTDTSLLPQHATPIAISLSHRVQYAGTITMSDTLRSRLVPETRHRCCCRLHMACMHQHAATCSLWSLQGRRLTLQQMRTAAPRPEGASGSCCSGP